MPGGSLRRRPSSLGGDPVGQRVVEATARHQRTLQEQPLRQVDITPGSVPCCPVALADLSPEERDAWARTAPGSNPDDATHPAVKPSIQP